MINDPMELMLGVTRPEVQEEVPEDPHEIRMRLFERYKPNRPDDTSYHNSMEIAVCRFEGGRHVQAGKHCPHYEVEDEEGPRIRNDWTAQQG